MIFHDHSQVVRGRERGQIRESIRSTIHLILVGSLVSSGCIDSDGVTAKKLGSLHPLVVILDGLLTLGRVSVSQIALTIDHDEKATNTLTFGASAHFLEIVCISRLILEELIDVFDGVNAELTLGNPRVIEVIHFPSKKSFVKRPFCD